MTSIPLQEITERFFEELSHIRKYTEFLEEKSRIFDREIVDISYTITHYGISNSKTLEDINVFSTFSYEEIKKITNIITSCVPEIEETIEHLRVLLEDNQISIDDIDQDTQEGSTINFFFECFDGGFSIDQMYYQLNIDLGEFDEDDEHDKKILDFYTEENILKCQKKAEKMYLISKYNSLTEIIKNFDDIKIMLKIMSDESVTNSFRQGFILIMTLLDATVFDLMRYALSIDFFTIIKFFGKQEKISMEDIGKYNSFDEFKEAITENLLKKRYIKDIFILLDDMDVIYRDNGDNKMEVFEMIQRRNIHIHNRGIVDEKYLEKNDNGVPKINIYGFNLGDRANIDENYWIRSNEICSNIVKKIAEWISTVEASKMIDGHNTMPAAGTAPENQENVG